MPNPVQQRRPPSKSVVVRARASREMLQRASARAVERVERSRAAWARATAAAHQRFLCVGCGLHFPRRRAAHPEGLPPYRCLCCDFLNTIGDVVAREALRRVLARNEIQRRFGGRDAPSLA